METDANDAVRELRAELAATQQKVQQLEAEREAGPARAGRRNFLKLAAAGTAVGGAVVLASADSAAAATNGNMIIGVLSNSASVNADTTGLDNPSTTDLARSVFAVRNFTATTNVVESNWRVAIFGSSADHDNSAGHRMAILGDARNFSDTDKKGIGVAGFANRGVNPTLPAEPVGVLGMANAQGVSGSGTGVKGFVIDGSSTIGVHGLTTTSTIGVQAEATAAGGIGLNAVAPTTGIAARVEGRFRQVTGGSAGAPSFPVGNAGEQWRDSNGDMWICTTTGAPGTWRKVVAQHPNFPSAGGSVNFLLNPIRILDTRASSTAPQNNGFSPLTANTDLVVDISTINVGGVLVPPGATGIIGNLTAVPLTSNGFMTLWAENVLLPGTSNINFRAGVNIANSFVCALSPAGKVRVRASVSTNVLLDVVGFLF